jgi:hypothetical protein
MSKSPARIYHLRGDRSRQVADLSADGRAHTDRNGLETPSSGHAERRFVPRHPAPLTAIVAVAAATQDSARFPAILSVELRLRQ